ncbi:GSCOCG00002916001-RA-CDS, partial [Cotesia congregata]
ASTKNLPVVQICKVQKKLPVFIRPYQESNHRAQESKVIKDTRDMAIQTDDLKKVRRILSPSKSNKRRESRQTQTNCLLKEKRSRKTVETQTSVGSVKELKKLSINKKQNLPKKDDLFSDSLPLDGMQELWPVRSPESKVEKNIIDDLYDNVTQTDILPFYQEDSITQLNSKNSLFSATRISRSDPMLTEEINDKFSSIETQTDRPYLDSIFDPEPNYSRPYAVSSNNETQTTQEFDDMKSLLYSNMCTQTCYDVLHPDLGLSDTQTQTAWSEELDVESSGHDKSSIIACRSWLSTQTSHTETQTDLLNIFDELQ